MSLALTSSPPRDDPFFRIEPRVYHYSSWLNVTLGVWVGQATLPAVKGIIKMAPKMIARYPNGHSSVVFVTDKLLGPTDDARPLLSRFFAPNSHVSCIAIILEGEGFWASGIRSMISNTKRAGNGSNVLRVATNIAEVVEWLPGEHARLTGVQLIPERLRETLTNTRRDGAALAQAPSAG